MTDRYQSLVGLSLANALTAHYLVGSKAIIPPCNCDVEKYLEGLPDSYLTELLFPKSLTALVRSGIIPDLPWKPYPAYIHI